MTFWHTTRRPLLHGALALLVLLGAAACSDDDPVGPDDDDVVVIRLTAANTFQPAQVTISPGTTVRWVNDADIFHTVTPEGHAEWARWETTRSDEAFEHTFQTTGAFDYFCEPHRDVGMVGVVRVE